MNGVQWIKITTDIFDDEKIQLIESMPEGDTLIVIWFKILVLAGKQNNSGILSLGNKVYYTEEMLSTVFRRKATSVKLALSMFEEFGMIEIIDGAITIPKWEKHQNIDGLEKIRKQTRERVARHRQKQKALITGEPQLVLDCNVTVTDENDNVVYHSSSKLFSFTNETTITDAQDRVVASIERKLFSLHSIHYIDVVGGKSFELSKDLFRLLDMKFTIDELGWTLQGDFTNLNFVLYNNQERVIAVVGQKLFSMRDKYCIDLYDVNEEATVVAIVITIENMLMARRSANHSTSHSHNSNM